MLKEAGPPRGDGSDSFVGFANTENNCYVNSIIQPLLHTKAFRELLQHYTMSLQNEELSHARDPISAPGTPMMNGAPHGQGVKGVSAAELDKIRTTPPPPAPPGAVQKPKDVNSPEYKKEQALQAGPIMPLTYENASHFGNGESTFTAFHDIYTALAKSNNRTGVLFPQRFLEVFKMENEMFRSAMHQDAHEFFGLLLNSVIQYFEDNSRLTRELGPPTPPKFSGSAENGIAHGMLSALSTAANAMGMSHSSAKGSTTQWVHDIFEGVLTSETKCLTCETASQRDETFLDLSIDLEQHSSVTSCLHKFSAEEMLCERNKFHCDHCGGLQEAEKRMKIKKLPKILTLHLKRFKYTEDMTRLQKLFHRVVYPYHLRMFNTTDATEDPDRLYELYAVVVHIGGNAYQGHYVTILKTAEHGWLLFDDEMVEPVDKHYVRNFFGDKPGMACAYVLFYQETTLEAVQREQEAEGAAEVARAAAVANLGKDHEKQNGTVPGGVKEAQMDQVARTTSGKLTVNTDIDPSHGYATSPHSAAPLKPLPLAPHDQALLAKTFSNIDTSNHTTSVDLPTRSPAREPAHKDSKEERERLKKEEKLRKQAEKEAAKQAEKERKEALAKEKEAAKIKEAEAKAFLAAEKEREKREHLLLQKELQQAEKSRMKAHLGVNSADAAESSYAGSILPGGRGLFGGLKGRGLSRKWLGRNRELKESPALPAALDDGRDEWGDTNTPPPVPEVPALPTFKDPIQGPSGPPRAAHNQVDGEVASSVAGGAYNTAQVGEREVDPEPLVAVGMGGREGDSRDGRPMTRGATDGLPVNPKRFSFGLGKKKSSYLNP